MQTWCQYPARDWGSGDDNTGFDQLEQQLLLWMGNINYTAEIFYIPLFLISLSPKLMLTPCYSSMFPLLEPDTLRAAAIWRTLHPGQSLTCAPGDWPSLTHELQTNVRELVASLHSLLSTLGAREEIWSVGSLARHIGDQLESWGPARHRRKTADNRLSVVLVDRSLDLGSGVSHGGDTVLARAVQLLDRLPGEL